MFSKVGIGSWSIIFYCPICSSILWMASFSLITTNPVTLSNGYVLMFLHFISCDGRDLNRLENTSPPKKNKYVWVKDCRWRDHDIIEVMALITALASFLNLLISMDVTTTVWTRVWSVSWTWKPKMKYFGWRKISWCERLNSVSWWRLWNIYNCFSFTMICKPFLNKDFRYMLHWFIWLVKVWLHLH